MSSHQEDLDLLLSLQDKVLETPPGSPGYLSDDGLPRQRVQEDLSVFKDVLKDCFGEEEDLNQKAPKLNQPKNKNDETIEKYSGLRIRNQLLTAAEISQRFSDIRFIRLPTIKNILIGDTISGSWTTVGVLTEKGNPRTSSNGKSYCIWKIACLDENTASLFLFGDAYQQNMKEQAGSVFALFNCNVRRDNGDSGFSLSVYSPSQMLKMGTSVDYGVCKGKRKDGLPCTIVINKRQGAYCKYHRSKASDRYSTMRTELKGGNLRTAFRNPLNARGIYMHDPLADRTNSKKSIQPVKLHSVEGLKKALSKADKVTTNTHSQGIRFLNHVTGKLNSKGSSKESAATKEHMASSEKRKLSTLKVDPSVKKELDSKRTKTDQRQVPADTNKPGTEKMIELDLYVSDEEI